MTDREKLIEGMARVICQSSSNRGRCDKCGFNKSCTKFEEATALYENGYGVTFAKDTDVPSKWISVKDEMPHAEYGESDAVLAVDGFGIVKMLYFDGGCWCHPTGETVVYENPRWRITHWMPLPQPPREE